MSKTVAIVSLGCDKNRVDSENLLAYLAEDGYSIAPIESADAVIINTCAFIDAAKTEAIDTILSAADEKRSDAKLIVCGCLPERYRESLIELLPEVNAFLGINDYAQISRIIEQSSSRTVTAFSDKAEPTEKRILTTPPHYAYLKIADGCNNHCTFCAIPSIRGKYRSRTIESLVSEAASLQKNYGVRELILVAQDTTRYGEDLYGKPSLKRLLQALCELDFDWIRVLYTYPELLNGELLDFMTESPKIVKYADIPLQHVSDGVLKTMGRRSTAQGVRELLSELKNRGFVVRSSFIAGFPTETEADFQQLLSFLKLGYVDYAGIFEYSAEEGTAAARLPQLDEQTKCDRRDRLVKAQSAVISAKNKRYVGKTVQVLYEDIDYDAGCFLGRTQYQAPDVDPMVRFTSDTPVQVGEFYKIQIIAEDGLDLIGEKRE